MKLFIKKIFLYFLVGTLPFIVLIIGYIILDPFRVVWKYDNYSNLHIIPNRDYVTTEMYLKNRKNEDYNSFIFGSSRTLAFNPDSWKKYIGHEARPFIFDASGETIFGIYKKIVFLDNLNSKLENVLIVVCPDLTFQTTVNSPGHLFIKHPSTSGESWITFHLTFLKSYFNTYFLRAYYEYTFTKNIRPFMFDYIEFRNIYFHPITNSMTIEDKELEINLNPEKYYDEREGVFWKRPEKQQEYDEFIGVTQEKMLKEIYRILNSKNSEYKIIISPLYEQKEINEKDLYKLEEIFGKDKIFNFSGINDITLKSINYYESSHYRPSVGDSIINYIYQN
ncbi:hypothetical protein [Algoriphagus sp.]|uniref:hypothetical protein n=1 Tax=Algoriphagus sp. TaxID=1872435 RepID=UPI00391D4B8C